MENYNIHFNRSELSQEQLKKGMDFSKVKKIAASRSGNSFYQAMIAATGVVLLMLAPVVIQKNRAVAPSADSVTALKSDDNQLTTFYIDTRRDTTLLFETGSIITIPANAFADENAKEVSGMVELNYREFHNVGEIILSQIPMTYDSAGQQYHFESAGMFELRAFKDGRTLSLVNDKTIQVNLVSLNDAATKFNQYYFDEASKQWVFKQKDIPVVITQGNKNPLPDGFDKLKPVLRKKQNYQFSIDIRYDEFPELEAMEEVLFEVSASNKNFDPSTAATTWSEVNMERIGNSNEYKIKFSNQQKEYEVIAQPVVDEKNYSKSKQHWDNLYQNYKMTALVKANKDKERERKLNEQLSCNVKAFDYYQALNRRNQILARGTSSTEEIVYRTFQIKSFGIWNSDCPESMPAPMIVKASYETEGGESVNVSSVYLIEHGKNALYSLYSGALVYLNPDNEYSLIVITKDNTIGYFKTTDFKALNEKTKEFTFKLKLIKKEKYTPADINGLI